jgi:hypothetical protein
VFWAIPWASVVTEAENLGLPIDEPENKATNRVE